MRLEGPLRVLFEPIGAILAQRQLSDGKQTSSVLDFGGPARTSALNKSSHSIALQLRTGGYRPRAPVRNEQEISTQGLIDSGELDKDIIDWSEEFFHELRGLQSSPDQFQR